MCLGLVTAFPYTGHPGSSPGKGTASPRSSATGEKRPKTTQPHQGSATVTVILDSPANRVEEQIRSLALEITGKCQNTCASHCYAKSGPGGSHGSMTRDDWFEVLDQAAGLGVVMVQYIGGEPTLHPNLPQLIERALSLGMRVEVFSNLVHIRPSMWEVFARPGFRLATSYYSDSAQEHEKITGGRGSYVRTKSNIIEATRRGIPLRASLVHVLDGQRVDAARAELRRIGVVGEIRTDRVRAIGKRRDQHPQDPRPGRAVRPVRNGPCSHQPRWRGDPVCDVAVAHLRRPATADPCRNPERGRVARAHGRDPEEGGQLHSADVHPRRGLVSALPWRRGGEGHGVQS